MLTISEAKTRPQLNAVRDIIRAFVVWHRQRHHEDIKLIDQYFDAKEFEEELAGLPGKYAQPRGRLLLATYGDRPVGCVALREIDSQTCEMKRMFVYPEYHGKGIGRALAATIIGEAQIIGYSRMLLDTSVRQIEAQTLYESFGFRHVKPYYELPKELRDWLVFMELEL